MILLVNGATKTVRKYACSNLGHLLSPRHSNSLDFVLSTGLLWAIDNDCFNSFSVNEYKKMIKKISGRPRLLFASAPDVVANAKATLELFVEWEPYLRLHRIPIAFVGQDGAEEIQIPWDRISAFFVGGTTEWKLGKQARELVREAKRRGLWVHMGRVNSLRRILYAQSIGCDSVDGTSFSRFPETYIPAALSVLQNEQQSLERILTV